MPNRTEPKGSPAGRTIYTIRRLTVLDCVHSVPDADWDSPRLSSYYNQSMDHAYGAVMSHLRAFNLTECSLRWFVSRIPLHSPPPII